MRIILILTILLIFPINVYAQPIIDPGMIEISYDGVTFVDASALVSNLTISTGTVTGEHLTHARRGSLITFEGQLGTPYSSMKASWLVDTGLVPTPENRLYIRFQFGHIQTLSDGTTKLEVSEFAEPSDRVQLIGKPGKAKNQG